MKKLCLLFLLLLAGFTGSYAQGLWLDPVTFSSPTYLCDTARWKLVFFDDFNGNSLDSTKWITHDSWKGMPKQRPNGTWVSEDNENWGGARYGFDPVNPYKHTSRKENIEVGGGMVKLYVKHKPNEWHCDTCNPVTHSSGTKYYTGAWLATYYVYNNVPKYFSQGKFEFRATLPNFQNAWTTIWTWPGEYAGVNELDFAEATGKEEYGSYNFFKKNWRAYTSSVMHPTHAWPANVDDSIQDPLPYHTEDDVKQDVTPYYPNQNWWNYFLFFNNFDFTDWHVYACEWDTTVVRTYLDHMKIHTLYKYYKPVNVLGYTLKFGSGCNASGTYEVSRGFPYRLNSASQFRMTAAVTRAMKEDKTNTEYTLGYAAIDYVKIWQRNPAQDGYTEICNTPPVNIVGVTDNSNFVCTNKKFTVNPLTAGTWSSDNSALQVYSNPNSNPVTVTNNPLSAGTNATLSFTYTPNGCPTEVISRNLYTQTVNPHALIVAAHNFLSPVMKLHLQVDVPTPGHNYTWEVWYGLTQNTAQYMYANGASVVTPNFVTNPYTLNPVYYVRWKLWIQTPCGLEVREGEKKEWMPFSAKLSDKLTYMDQQGNAYVGSVIKDENMQLEYTNEVRHTLLGRTLEEEADSATMYSTVHQAEVECLAPYIYFADLQEDEEPIMSTMRLPASTETKVYPNPTKDRLTVILSKTYMDKVPVSYQVIDLKGSILSKGLLDEAGNINTQRLATGAYILEVTQNNKSEKIKFQKL